MENEIHAKRRRRGVTKGLTLGTAATVLATLLVAPAAQAADVPMADPKAPSAAHGQAVALDGLALDLLGAAASTSEFDGAAGGLAGLDLSVLGQQLKLGNITLPLLKNPADPSSTGLLEVGDVSLLRGFSKTSSKTSATASAGTITDEGGLNLAGNPNDELNAAKIDLTALLAQLGLDGVTNEVVDELSLEVGALGARVEKTDEKLTSEYSVADVKANVGAPLVDGLTTGLDGVVSNVGGLLDGLLGSGGLVAGVTGALKQVLNVNLGILSLKSTDVRTEINGLETLVDKTLDELVRTPLQNQSGSVTVSLSTGMVTLDLADLAIEGNGYTSLDDLPANTELLNDKTITAITNGLTEALLSETNPNSLLSKLTAILTDHLWNSVTLDIFVDAEVKALIGILPIADTTVQLTGTLAEFAGHGGKSLDADNVKFELDLLKILPLGNLLEPVVKPLLNVIGTSLTGPLLEFVEDSVLTQLSPLVSTLVSGLLDPLLGTLTPVLEKVATVTINEQTKPGEQGDLGAGSHTTNALAVELLPGLLGDTAVRLELGNASVKAADIVTSLQVTPNPVKQGGTVTITGAGYGAREEVKISSDLGADKTVEADANGAFTATWAVPASQNPGALKFSATGATSKRTADATVTVESVTTGANANADSNATSDATATADADSNATSDATATADADSNATSDATATATATANANASASASADSNANAAAKAAANADATSAASAKGDVSAQAAAQAAANPTASTNATAKAGAASQAAAQAAANHKTDSDANAAASAKGNSDASAAAKAAAIADASSDASGSNPNPNTKKCLTPSSKSPFLDTPTNHKFYTEIDWMYCMKYTTGIKSDAGPIYGPKLRLSREAMAAFIYRLEDPKGYKAPPVSKMQDMKRGDKFYTEINWMVDEGLSTGIRVENGKREYWPKSRLSREAMAAFIHRLANDYREG